MSDYIPDSDADFSDWLDQFVNYLDQNMNELHLTPAEVAPLVAARSEFNDAVSNNDATQAHERVQ
jgi:hypothetical protein